MHVVAYFAHADDEVLACGGLLAKLASQGHRVTVVLATDALVKRSEDSDNSGAAHRAAGILGITDLHFLGFPDQRFDDFPIVDFNRAFEALGLDPDLVITHSDHDVNNDHTVVARSASVIARPVHKRIKLLACETLSSTEWGTRPFVASLYVDISEQLSKKVDAMRAYEYELRQYPHPRSLEGIEIKARQRGLEVGLAAAEAFQVLRWFDV